MNSFLPILMSTQHLYDLQDFTNTNTSVDMLRYQDSNLSTSQIVSGTPTYIYIAGWRDVPVVASWIMTHTCLSITAT